jgi:3-deoxy-7-phosphoheptulonate synthase
MCLASVACGCDGLIVEVHPDPKKSVSDASQTISPAALKEIVEVCRRVAAAVGKRM